MTQHRYMKRCHNENDEPWTILRESLENPFDLQSWRIDKWEPAIDLWWQTRQECDYWDISEEEALAHLPALSSRQESARVERLRQEQETHAKILHDRQQERIRKSERNEWTALESAAIALHELFGTLVDAGFTEDQSLTLIARGVFQQGEKNEQSEDA